MGSLRGVDHRQAAWKPYRDRHSIWELALHIAYWKYSIRRYLDPDAEKGFTRSPADWPEAGEVSEKTWSADKKLVKEEHEKLNELIRSFPEEKMDHQVEDKKWTYGQLIIGIAAHDTYHVGQIQLMKRLYKEEMES